MADQFEWWRQALKGSAGEIHETTPQPGYYKMREARNGPWQPVAIWHNGTGLVCRVGSATRDPHEVWTWCAGNPVPKNAAKQAFETGSWPGDIPQIGDNSGTLSLPEEIEDTATNALDWLSSTGIKDKTTADMAANWRAKLLDLGKQADQLREAEKRPHDNAAKAVQAKWRPSLDRAAAAANRLREALTLWMRAEDVKAKAEAAERAREAEKTRAMFGQPPLDALPDPPPRVQTGGQRGRKTGLRTVTVYDITDYAAALAHVKDHDDVRAAVEKVCRQMARAGVVVPGVTTREEQVAA